MPAEDKPIRSLKAGWQEVVLVCRRCSKRLDGGFGPAGKAKLAKVLRRELGRPGKKTKARRARVAVLEVGCFDVCPRGGVVVARAGRPGRWLVVPAGTPPAAVLQQLDVERPDSKNGPAGPS